MRENETFCHRCLRVVKTTIAGACVACGVMAAAPAVSPGQVGAFVPFGSVVTAVPLATADGPHVAEQDFLTHIPGAEIVAGGGGTVIQGTANVHAEGHVEAGGTVVPAGQLSGSDSLTA